VLLDRIRSRWQSEGVTFELAASTYVEPEVSFGRDVIVEPHVVLKGRASVGEGARVGAFSYLEGAEIPPGAVVPPYTRISGSWLGARADEG
jgi:bifunctional UDP-N-acetylglucosamine pyrophosphorylase/glucosamine-1-phosphate N-acetyltransferase